MKTEAEKKKEKPVPDQCICRKMPVDVKTRKGVMLTCPSPMKCPANLRTRWHKGIDSAVVEWNNLIFEYRHISTGGNYGN